MARRGSSTKQLKEKRKSFLKVKTKSARGRTKGRAIEGKKITSRKKGMSNIPAGEGTVNNPNYGKKGDLSMFKTKKKVVKKETPKKETPKKETPKKETPKKETPKKETPKKVIKSTTKGGPVKSGVEYARSKGDDLAGYRRGPNKALGKDTRITKELKKSGFTEDRLARLRKKHAEFKAKRRKKKTKLKIGG
jgi:hypothetical protein